MEAVEVSRYRDLSMPAGKTCRDCGTPVPGEIWYIAEGNKMHVFGNCLVLLEKNGKYHEEVFCANCISSASIESAAPSQVALRAFSHREARKRAKWLNSRRDTRRFTARGNVQMRMAAKRAVKKPNKAPEHFWWMKY